MSYKKLVSLFAVSALALGACGSDDAADGSADDANATDEVEEVMEEVEETGEDAASSTQDLLEQAKEESGEAYPDYGLTVTGDWTQDGYIIGHPEGEEAVIPVEIVTENETYNVYLLEDGVITDMMADEPEIEFVVADPSDSVDYHVGVSPEDLGAEGDEVDVEDFERSEKVMFEIAEPEEEE